MRRVGEMARIVVLVLGVSISLFLCRKSAPPSGQMRLYVWNYKALQIIF